MSIHDDAFWRRLDGPQRRTFLLSLGDLFGSPAPIAATALWGRGNCAEYSAHLLMAVEALMTQSLATAREMAIDATRSISRSDGISRNTVRDFLTRWMATVSREAGQRQLRSDEGERHRADRMVARTGSDRDGRRQVLERELTFVSSTDGHAYAQVPALIEGYSHAMDQVRIGPCEARTHQSFLNDGLATFTRRPIAADAAG